MTAPRCTVAACHAHDALAQALSGVIAAAELFSVGRHALSLCDADCDLLVPIVDAGNVARMAGDIALWRHGHPHASVVPAVIDLSQSQLLDLMTSGAFDFTSLPGDDAAMLVRLQRAAGLLPAQPLSPQPMPPHLVASPALRELVGSSPAFVKQLALLPGIAGCDAGVLILGETGSGKEIYARAIHYSSARATRPLVAVNCGAIPAELLESELFGHVRGAFTHAHTARAGLVREAQGGTLFLDEVDSLPAPAQSKLLRFLQEMEFRPVGGDTVQNADVRVIAASNQDLPGLVERGLFRRDLYFRLHVLSVTLPPLRERAEDIVTLALRFIQQCAAQNRRPTLGLSPQAMRRLLAHDWPGNVRELKHVIERAVLLADHATIQEDDLELPAHGAPLDADESFRAAKSRMVDAFERCYIERLLAASGGNITQAAEMAKKNRRAFFELIRKHEICTERFRA
ncbi:sigma-54 interaction domain-containing protein [Rhizobacter sp. P5_C2]